MNNCFLYFSAFAAVASAFSVVPSMSRRQNFGRTSPLFNSVEPTKEEQAEEGLDLNLEEMFTMFDAAERDEEFGKAIKAVKKDQ
jgi:hypothetical protein